MEKVFFEKVITKEYLKQKMDLRKEHRDLSDLHGIKYEIESLCGYLEEVMESGKEDNDWCIEFEESDLRDKIHALNVVTTKLIKEEDELYKKYGLKEITKEDWKKEWKK